MADQDQKKITPQRPGSADVPLTRVTERAEEERKSLRVNRRQFRAMMRRSFGRRFR